MGVYNSKKIQSGIQCIQFRVFHDADRVVDDAGRVVDDADRVFELAEQAGIAITQLRQQRSSLEDVFLRAVGAKAHTGSDSISPDRVENRNLLEERP